MKIRDQFVEPNKRLEGLEFQDLQMAGVVPHPALTPEEIVRIREVKKRIDEILRTLSSREEIIVRMCIMGDKTQEEAAELTGTTKEVVRNIRAEAMRKLRCSGRARVLALCLPEIS
jgi:RNA polymerase sigma factor (sigma-70 family)